jgi:hypothetical protein
MSCEKERRQLSDALANLSTAASAFSLALQFDAANVEQLKRLHADFDAHAENVSVQNSRYTRAAATHEAQESPVRTR